MKSLERSEFLYNKNQITKLFNYRVNKLIHQIGKLLNHNSTQPPIFKFPQLTFPFKVQFPRHITVVVLSPLMLPLSTTLFRMSVDPGPIVMLSLMTPDNVFVSPLLICILKSMLMLNINLWLLTVPCKNASFSYKHHHFTH